MIRYAVLIGVNRAASSVNRDTRSSVRALVESVRYAVVVSIRAATVSIDREASSGVRALVEVVSNAVVVGVNRATLSVNSDTSLSISALVEVISNAVIVRVNRAAVSVDRSTRSSVRALVEVVSNTVIVRVNRAAVRSNAYTSRSFSALVDAISNTVIVGVNRAASSVNNSTSRSFSALVNTVEDTVIVAVHRAAVSVNNSTSRSACALVDVVGYAIVIFVSTTDVTEAPSKSSGTSKARSRGIAVLDHAIVLVNIVQFVCFSSMHFVFEIPAHREGADTHIETEGDVDVGREVETETRSKSERIITRITRICTLFYAEFTVSFEEDVHPIGREDIEATAIDQGISTTADGADETNVTVDAERSANLLEIEGEDQFTTNGHAIEGVRMSSVAFSVQEPSMTRTDTHRLVASGEVELSGDSSIEDAIRHFIEREFCLCPEFEVTTASLPQVTFRDLFGVGMIVVERKHKTYVHEVRNTCCKIDICSKASRSFIESVLLTVLFDLATAREGP